MTWRSRRSRRRRVLIVDDEPGVRESVRMLLKDAYEPVAVGSAPEALSQLGGGAVRRRAARHRDAGHRRPRSSWRTSARGHPTLPVVMLTATKTVKTAVDAMKLGAFDYLTKPFDVDELRLVLDKATENAALVREVEALRTRGRPALPARQHRRRARPACRRPSRPSSRSRRCKTTVLITGESGTGKELIAKAIHYGSPRARKPLVTLNCAAIPETLLESELFGHERGSFTDAHAKKLGQFELAHEGTLFLDEIGEMGPSTAGEAPARARDGRVPARRRTASGARRRAHHRRHQPRPGGGHRATAPSAPTSTTA